MSVFAYDNLSDAINTNSKETFRLFVPVFVLISFAQIAASLPSFTEQPAIVYFQYQMIFAIIILKLMLLNMANRPFTQFNSQYIYALLPIILYQVVGISDTLEIYLTRACTLMAFLEFYASIY